MLRGNGSSPPASGRRARCLLLTPGGCDPPPELLEGLRRRGAELREVTDAPAAMAALGRGGWSTVILIEPQMLPDASRLVGAIRQYHPRVGVWRHQRGHEPPLQRITSPQRNDRAADAPAHRSGAERRTVDASAAFNSTEGDRTAASRPVDPPEATDPSAGSELTEQELHMLLSPGEGEREKRTDGQWADG